MSGKKVSTQVKPHEMGLLRQAVKVFGEDARGVVACLVTYAGWHDFTSILKVHGKLVEFLDWPRLKDIVSNPDVALEIYLQTMQAAPQPIGQSETKRILAKISKLKEQEWA
jgi:hypothetical protein